jgi:glycosyltransferase involved in cell wall biosynthesis
MSPQVSIIIPCYNTARYVAQALQSVFAQSFTDFEVVLVNDGSPDTPELEAAIAPWRDRMVYRKTPNGGAAAARNRGIEAARGEFIALLDSDDFWHPDYLAVQLQTLRDSPHADVVYPNAVVFYDPPCTWPSRLVSEIAPSRGEVTFTSLVNQSCIVMVSALMRRTVFERAGCFDEGLRRCEDFDFWLRCIKHGATIVYHQRPVVHYRRHNDSLSTSHDAMLDARISVLRKALSELALTAAERLAAESEIARSIAARKYLEAKQHFLQGNVAACARHLWESNRLYRSLRVAAMWLTLATVPALAKSAYRVRLRLRSR